MKNSAASTCLWRLNLASACLLFPFACAFAQWDGAKAGIAGLYDNIAGLLQVVMGLGLGIVLVMLIIRVAGGRKEAARSLVWWVVGLLFGMIALEIVKNVFSTIAQ